MDFKYYIIFVIVSIIVLSILNSLAKSKQKSKRTAAYIGLVIYFIIFFIFMYLKVSITLEYLLLNPLTIGVLICAILAGFVYGYTFIRNYKARKHKNGMEREIEVDYSPSVVTCLLRQNLSYKDLIADIMNLYARKIINIDKKENNKITFKLNDRNTKTKIGKSDAYIIETLIDDSDNKKFNFNIWKKSVNDEYQKYGFSDINIRKMLTLKSMGIFVICIGIIGAIIVFLKSQSLSEAFIGLIVGMIIGTLIVCYLLGFADKKSNSDMFLNERGKKELGKWIGIKEFMEQYTLIKDRSFEEIVLYESYIPYAISLGVNTTYKNTKFDIFDIEEIESIMNENKATTFLERLGMDFENF